MSISSHKNNGPRKAADSQWLAQANQTNSVCDSKNNKSIRDEVAKLAIENAGKLGGFIFSRVKDVALAQDIFQQSLMIAHKNYDSFRGESSRSTWLIGISRNLIRNHFSRSPEYNYTFVNSDLLNSTSSASKTPEQEAEIRETMDMVYNEISKLPSKLREVVDSVILKQNSYKQASKDLKVSSGTIRSRLSRARTSLRKAMPK